MPPCKSLGIAEKKPLETTTVSRPRKGQGWQAGGGGDHAVSNVLVQICHKLEEVSICVPDCPWEHSTVVHRRLRSIHAGAQRPVALQRCLHAYPSASQRRTPPRIRFAVHCHESSAPGRKDVRNPMKGPGSPTPPQIILRPFRPTRSLPAAVHPRKNLACILRGVSRGIVESRFQTKRPGESS